MARHRARPLSVTPQEFDDLVQQAVRGLPRQYQQHIENISVVVEEEPPRQVLEEMGVESEDDLLGLYTGVAKDAESFFDPAGHLPARIAIYRGPILRLCRTKDEVVQEVRETVAHEIGHHFGLDDDDMPY